MEIVHFNDTKTTKYYEGLIPKLNEFFEQVFDESNNKDEKIKLLTDFYNEKHEDKTFFFLFLNTFCNIRYEKRDFVQNHIILDFLTNNPISTEDFKYIKNQQLKHLYSMIVESNLFPQEEKKNYFFIPNIFTVYPKDSFEYYLKNDLIADFQQFIANNPTFDINKEIENNLNLPPYYVDLSNGKCSKSIIHQNTKRGLGLRKSNNISLIDLCCFYGSIKCFKYLLLNDCKLKEESCQYAVAGGNLEIIHILEQKEFDFEECLRQSIKYHRNEISDWLLTNYKETNNENYIETAIKSYNIPAFLYYFINRTKEENEKRFPIDKNEDKVFQIHKACEIGSLILTEFLIEHCNVNIDSQDKNGQTPLMIASERGYLDIVKYLIEKGANTEAKTKIDGKTALHWAPKENLLEFGKYLVEHCNVNIDSQSNVGFTPLMIASEKGNLNVVKCLCEKGANTEAKDEKGRTALYLASRKNHFDIVEYLITKKKY